MAVTETGPYIAPAGKVTVRKVVVAEVTVAFTGPKYTVLAPGVLPKLFPLMETNVPACPDAGVNDVTIGWPRRLDIYNKQVMVRRNLGTGFMCSSVGGVGVNLVKIYNNFLFT